MSKNFTWKQFQQMSMENKQLTMTKNGIALIRQFACEFQKENLEYFNNYYEYKKHKFG